MKTLRFSSLSIPRVCSYLMLVTLLGACTWVKKSPEGATVRVVPADRVADCTALGNVTTTTMSNVTVIKRKAAKVEQELQTLAQNKAVESGADTIVAGSEVVDGMRTFAMYKCL